MERKKRVILEREIETCVFSVRERERERASSLERKKRLVVEER